MAQFPSTLLASDIWNETDVFRACAGDNWPANVANVANILNDAYSSTAQTFSLYNGVSVSSFSPFSGCYSADFTTEQQAILWSASASMSFGSDFTIEGFFRQSSTVQKCIIGSDYAVYNNNFQSQFNEGNVSGRCGLYDNSSWTTINASSSPINTWFHLAIVRSGSSVKIFLDGVLQGTFNSGAVYDFGASGAGGALGALRNYFHGGWIGQITNFRLTASAIYTSNFTVPTSQLGILSQTKILLPLSQKVP